MTYSEKVNIVHRLRDTWTRDCNEPLRFGQFLANALGDVDLFYVKDEHLAELAERFTFIQETRAKLHTLQQAAAKTQAELDALEGDDGDV